MLKPTHKFLIVISAICYTASWFVPVFIATDKEGTGPMSGLSCLINGLFAGWLFFHFEAFANLFYIVALPLLFCSDTRPAYWISLIGLIIASQAFTMHGFHFELASGNFKIESIQAGFYLWYLAILIAAGVAVSIKKSKERSNAQQLPETTRCVSEKK
jgi:hypothetical protein